MAGAGRAFDLHDTADDAQVLGIEGARLYMAPP